MQTSEFAVAQWIDHEPAFNCWVKHVLEKRDGIIASIKKWQTGYLKRSQKFGIELPKIVKELMPWMTIMAIHCRQMQYPKKWRISEQSKSYQMGN